MTTASMLVAAAWTVVGCGGGPGSSQQVKQGQRLYGANCALCHGYSGEGKARLGKALQENEFVRSTSDPELVEFLKIGRRADDPLNQRGIDMPPRGGNPALSDQDLRLIVAFLRTLS